MKNYLYMMLIMETMTIARTEIVWLSGVGGAPIIRRAVNQHTTNRTRV